MLKAIVLSSIIINVGLLLGRLTGFLREIFIAKYYGLSKESDIIIFILTMPDLLVNILVGGGLAAALIPEFTDPSNKNKVKLLFQSSLFFLVASTIMALFFICCNVYIINFLAPGFDETTIKTIVPVFNIALLMIPLTVLAGTSTAYLNANNKFFTSSFGTLFVNIFIIIGIVFSTYNGLIVLAVFLLVGGFVRLAFQYYEIYLISGIPFFKISPWTMTKEVVYRYLQVALSGSILLCFPVIIRALSTNLGEGYLSAFNYSLKLVELPQAIFIGFIAIVTFPRLSAAYISNNLQFRIITTWGFRLSLFFSLVALSLMFKLSDHVVGVVFGYGEIDSDSVARISAILEVLVLSIPFVGLSTYLMTVFNAMKKTHIPLFINLVSLVSLIILANIVDASGWYYAHIYVFSYSISAFLSLIILFYIDRGLLNSMLDLKWLLLIFIFPIFIAFCAGYIDYLYIDSYAIVGLSFLLSVVVVLVFLFIIPAARHMFLERVIKID